MIKRIFLFNFLLWTVLITAFPQNASEACFEKGYVCLKNGTVFKGKYIYSSTLDKVRVITGKTSRVFNVLDVEMISRSKPDGKLIYDDNDSGFPLSTKKFFNLTEIGVLVGNPDNKKDAPFIFHSSLNYNFDKKFSAGFGLGVEFLNETYMPVTLNVMYRLKNSKISPFVMLQGGYEIPIDGSRITYNKVIPQDFLWNSYWTGNSQEKLDAKGGFLFNPSIGLLLHLNSNVGLNMSVGYRYNRLNYSADKDYKLDVDYNRLMFKLGITIY